MMLFVIKTSYTKFEATNVFGKSCNYDNLLAKHLRRPKWWTPTTPELHWIAHQVGVWCASPFLSHPHNITSYNIDLLDHNFITVLPFKIVLFFLPPTKLSHSSLLSNTEWTSQIKCFAHIYKQALWHFYYNVCGNFCDNITFSIFRHGPIGLACQYLSKLKFISSWLVI